jgi:hypothetical protein
MRPPERVEHLIGGATGCLVSVDRPPPSSHAATTKEKRVRALIRHRSDDRERGDASGWSALAGLATVSVVAMAARYQELLVHALSTAVETTFGGPPGV